MHATAYPAPRVVHGKSIQRIRAEEVLLLPLVQAGHDLHQIVALANETSAVPASAKDPAGEASFQPSKETK